MPTSEPRPAWLEGVTTPGEAFRRLIRHLSTELKDANQEQKVLAFREGVDRIREKIGPLTVSAEFTAGLPGREDEDVQVFVGKPGLRGTPVVAFDAAGRIWTGSVEASLGLTPEGGRVFNAFRANRHR